MISMNMKSQCVIAQRQIHKFFFFFFEKFGKARNMISMNMKSQCLIAQRQIHKFLNLKSTNL